MRCVIREKHQTNCLGREQRISDILLPWRSWTVFLRRCKRDTRRG